MRRENLGRKNNMHIQRTNPSVNMEACWYSVSSWVIKVRVLYRIYILLKASQTSALGEIELEKDIHLYSMSFLWILCLLVGEAHEIQLAETKAQSDTQRSSQKRSYSLPQNCYKHLVDSQKTLVPQFSQMRKSNVHSHTELC